MSLTSTVEIEIGERLSLLNIIKLLLDKGWQSENINHFDHFSLETDDWLEIPYFNHDDLIQKLKIIFESSDNIQFQLIHKDLKTGGIISISHNKYSTSLKLINNYNRLHLGNSRFTDFRPLTNCLIELFSDSNIIRITCQDTF